jgi:hypothetical protein
LARRDAELDGSPISVERERILRGIEDLLGT